MRAKRKEKKTEREKDRETKDRQLCYSLSLRGKTDLMQCHLIHLIVCPSGVMNGIELNIDFDWEILIG